MADRASYEVKVIDSAAVRIPLPLAQRNGVAHAILWPGNGAVYRTVNILSFEADGRSIDLSHSEECVYYIVKGAGAIRDLDDGASQPLREGSMVHISPADRYRLEAGPSGLEVIGGCVPVDMALYEIGAKEAIA